MMDCNTTNNSDILLNSKVGGRCGHDRMIVRFTTTYVYLIHKNVQHYVIKFVSDLRKVSGFLQVLRIPPPKKTYRHDITEILLKVALNTITLTPWTLRFLKLRQIIVWTTTELNTPSAHYWFDSKEITSFIPF